MSREGAPYPAGGRTRWLPISRSRRSTCVGKQHLPHHAGQVRFAIRLGVWGHTGVEPAVVDDGILLTPMHAKCALSLCTFSYRERA